MPQQEFLAGGSQVGEIFLACLQACHCGGGCQTGGIDITLPVGAHNDAALAVLPSAAEDGILQFGSHLCQDEGGGPTQGGVPRGIGAVATQELFVVEGTKHVLVHPGEGAFAHVAHLGAVDSLFGRPLASRDEAVDGGRKFFTDSESQCLAVDFAHASLAVERLPAGALAARGVAHALAPEPLREVVDEELAAGVGRRRQEEARIGHLVVAEIGDGIQVLRDGGEAEAEQNKLEKEFLHVQLIK